VDVQASLVSPGTELGGWRSLAAAREDPDPDADPRPFGYSNAGVVKEVTEGAEEFSVGDRVACIGGGYAMHTNLAVVPHNLCVALPAGVTFAQGSYAMLAATALHALRRGEPELGESVAVAGLGIVGQLTAQFHRLAGNYVIGWDMIARRLEIARGWGIDATADVAADDVVETTRAFTRGYGLDAGVIAMGGDGNAAAQALAQCLKVSPDGHGMGRLVLVGGAFFNYPFQGANYNADVRRAGRTGFGYHDEDWETGAPYPAVVMRWTTRTNLELCMRFIEEGRLDVDCLTTHTVPFANAEATIDAALDTPDDMLGVVFDMSQ
jgi:threonine dehydrogenase-like Zn-dependent dehydrogenase